MSDMRGVGTRPAPRQTRGGRTRVCTTGTSKYTVLGSSTRSLNRPCMPGLGHHAGTGSVPFETFRFL